ncbi:ABC transporter substrate-binding protein [Sinomonas sp. JGH33]|uniref:ABC transporter substrate-binding protein n=1 Tax=Sinomonas terricola TaxID=3110330 RepID=A0ABU5T1W5_9MICC|nr:ABC transporter substrate-binding protein [Sinomonas sp. JGH33]MEA5453639.1 ABC transporter substrate-binding protein [Sinomonas sp. JGH33]
MTFTTKLAVKSAVVLAASALALTACTNASETGGGAQPSGSGSAGASFDPSSVKKDDSLASQVPAAIKSKGTLTVGSDTTYAPAEFLGGSDNHTPMGYDVDLAKAIGATLGLKVDVETAEFTGILPALGPKYDLGISSFTITKERLGAVNFVSYFNAGVSWAVQKGNPKKFSVDDVCGKSVGVQTGTTEADEVKALSDKCTAGGKKAVDIVSLDKQTDLNTRLVNGALDAMSADSPVISYAITQTNGAVEKIGDTTEVAPEGIAIAKGDTALADLIQKTVTKLIADGTYKKILDTWNNSEGAVTKAELNPSVSS